MGEMDGKVNGLQSCRLADMFVGVQREVRVVRKLYLLGQVHLSTKYRLLAEERDSTLFSNILNHMDFNPWTEKKKVIME